MALSTLLSAAAMPVAGLFALAQPSTSFFDQIAVLGSMLNTPSVGTYDAQAAQYDGRIQGRDLLSSHFGPIGWPHQSFDYVIVGGGTAGLAMAKRLSEGEGNSVALIEAGGFYEVDAGNATEVPMYLFNYFFDNGYMKNPLFDWYQYTEPQEGLHNREMFYMQGKTLGGSTARGAMLYHRGSKGAYQKWADQVGDDSYTWEKWLPHFQRGIKFSGPNTNPRPANATAVNDDTAWSATGGPVHVAYPYLTNAISSWVDKALDAFGFTNVEGFSNGVLLGKSYITHTINPFTRRRETASSSYLREALVESNNLNIYIRTLAKKVLFDENKKANAVEVQTDGFKWKIEAKKEVILSAGFMRSPQLLMVSGIGPKETLEKLEIPVLSDRPGVGQNLQDTIILGPTNPIRVESHSQLLGGKDTLPRSIDDYNNHRAGLLTNPGQDFFAFEKHAKEGPGSLSQKTAADIDANFPADWPTYSFIALDDTFVPQFNGKNYFSMSAALMTTFSRGYVSINSTDTLDNPIVDPKWLSDPRDRELAVAAFRRCRQFTQHEVLQDVIDGEELLPGKKYQTDEEVLGYIAETSDAYYAGVGTAAMGKKDDPQAVLDSKARVLGVEGLRVVDASSFPFAIDGQPMGTVYALAEKIAADILAGN
uniref:Versicolorin B synthase n=1 Tax=Mycosphaerella arachidis TaxID=143450 RepID=E2EAH6_9PEZI|nr:versicolorin B synthase [Passalora arachidicola]